MCVAKLTGHCEPSTPPEEINLSVIFITSFLPTLVICQRGFVCIYFLFLSGTRLTSCGSVTTAPCCASDEIRCVKYSLQEARTQRWALKRWPSATTVTSHMASRRRCSSRQRSTCEECTVDSNVNTDDREADVAIRDIYMHAQTHTHTLVVSVFPFRVHAYNVLHRINNKNMPTFKRLTLYIHVFLECERKCQLLNTHGYL